MSTHQQVPVVKELFRWSASGAELIGTRCAGCGTHYFPKSLSCRNPLCVNKQMLDTFFGSVGKLHSFTIQAYRPPPLFKMDPWIPYAIGLVELPEGLRVMGMLTGSALGDWRIDMSVGLTVEPLYRDEHGCEVLTYKYRPLPPNASSA